MLNVGASGLTSLPDRLPPHITKLVILGNNLTHLPALPEGLRELKVSGNPLTSLPALPSELQMLWVYNNPLTSLPELPSGLGVLDVSNNQLTRLPQSLTGLSSAAVVNLGGNPLSVRTLQALRDIIGHSGIRIHFDMAGSSVPPGTAPGGR